MKRVAIAVAVLLLAGCSSPSEKVAGQVVSCESISSSTTENSLVLDCLDGGIGASIDSIKGPAVINVWASWCTQCKEEMPILRSFYEKAQDKLLFIGVDVEEASIDDGRKFVENYGITWPNLFDSDGRSRAYFGMGVPVTWFIAADGSVAYKHIGIINSEKQLISLTSKHLGIEI